MSRPRDRAGGQKGWRLGVIWLEHGPPTVRPTTPAAQRSKPPHPEQNPYRPERASPGHRPDRHEQRDERQHGGEGERGVPMAAPCARQIGEWRLEFSQRAGSEHRLEALTELIHAEPARASVLTQPFSDALAVGIRGAERGIALWPTFIPDVMAPDAHDASRIVPLLQPLARGQPGSMCARAGGRVMTPVARERRA